MNETRDPSPQGAVVVGIDGSAGSAAALHWATSEARLRKAPLRLVHAWTFGYAGVAGGGFGGDLGLGSSDDVGLSELHRAAERLLEDATAELSPAIEDIEIERLVVEGPAAAVLVGAVSADDLLVVGSRGHGGFAGLLLGSVSQQCAHHAPCPVVIVHAGSASE